MPILYPSTIAFIKLCVNIVVRAVVVAAAWCVMAATAIILNFVLDYLVSAFGMPEPVRRVLSQLALGYPIVLAIAILITGIIDVMKLTIVGIRGSNGNYTGDST